MSQDRVEEPGGWTFETLNAHLTSLIESNDRRYEQRFNDSQTAVGAALAATRTAIDAALSAAEKAVMKAELSADKRFEGVNEFRAQLADQQRTLMPRTEAELRFASIDARLAKMDGIAIERRGHVTGGRELWGWIVGVLGLVALLWNLFGKGP